MKHYRVFYSVKYPEHGDTKVYSIIEIAVSSNKGLQDILNITTDILISKYNIQEENLEIKDISEL